jgi:hypothetical protein
MAYLPVIGLVALLVYLVLWQTGWIDELSAAGAARRARPKAKKEPRGKAERSRLNVFEEFIERLGEDEEPPPPGEPSS